LAAPQEGLNSVSKYYYYYYDSNSSDDDGDGYEDYDNYGDVNGVGYLATLSDWILYAV
jgi:hypothetical protein